MHSRSSKNLKKNCGQELNRNPLIFLTLCFVALTMFAGCKDSVSGDNDDVFDIETYSGSPYTGPATLTLMVPNQGSASGNGTGAAQMVDQENGQAIFNLEALIEINGEDLSLGLPFTGHYDETGWIEEGGDLEITADGTISGGGQEDGLQFQVEGVISESSLTAQLEIEFLEDNGNVPQGTTFLYEYDLGRNPAAEAAIPLSGSADNGYDRFVQGVIHGVPNLDLGRRD